MNHFHLRFTPWELHEYDLNSSCDRDGIIKIVCAYENKSKDGTPAEPHYHIYGETDLGDDTIRSYFRSKLGVPKTTRGKASRYYTLEWNKYDTPSPSYVCKYGCIKYQKGYTQEEIEHYITEGRLKYLEPSRHRQTQQTQLTEQTPPLQQVPSRERKRTIKDQYDEYAEYVLPADRTMGLSWTTLRQRSLEFWLNAYGLLPTRSTDERFKKTLWIQWHKWYKKCPRDEVAIEDEFRQLFSQP